MNINTIKARDIVYYYRLGQRVTVRWVDLKSEYVQIVDKEGNTYEVHISKLEAVTDDLDMSEDEILKREE